MKLMDWATPWPVIRPALFAAEMGHLNGFAFVTDFALFKTIAQGPGFGLTFMAVNVLMNPYPVLLLQANKRRNDLLMALGPMASAK